MSNIKGRELYELLQNGTAALSEDKNTLINAKTKEILASKVASKDGINYFKALGDESTDRGTVKICLEWGWDEKNKIQLCLEWTYEEKA